MLWLEDNPITDEGLKIIADQFPNLTELDLGGITLTGEAVDELSRSRHLNILGQVHRVARHVTLLAQTDANCTRVVYQLGRGGGKLPNWSSRKTGRLTGNLEWSKSPSGRDYIGPFGQQAITLRLSGLPVHKNVQVEIELWVIGSWDGDGRFGAGPDIIDISVPNIGTADALDVFFNNNEGNAANAEAQSFPDPYPSRNHKAYTGASEVRSLGFTEPWDGVVYRRDAVYKLQYTFTHSTDGRFRNHDYRRKRAPTGDH